MSVEGELRYREFVPKKQKKSKNGDQKICDAEIHLSKIAKLDRAEKRDSDAPVPEAPQQLAPKENPRFTSRLKKAQRILDSSQV